MGKVKVKKKDARIDMTAMSDVTVLLLTFFMLTSTFLQKEPVQVITPPSVSEEKVPIEKLMTVLISQQNGKPQIFLELTGTADSTLTTEDLRQAVLESMYQKYNLGTPTSKEILAFRKSTAFGCPMSRMKEWLNLPQEDRDKSIKTGGIPIAMNYDIDHPNEFQSWVQSVYSALRNAGVEADMESGKGIALKADQSTPYSIVGIVMNNLQTIKMNRFTLMTALKTEEGQK